MEDVTEHMPCNIDRMYSDRQVEEYKEDLQKAVNKQQVYEHKIRQVREGMQQEDNFLEEYEALCRKYGLCFNGDSCGRPAISIETYDPYGEG